MKSVNSNGIRLVQIWEDDWINNKEVITNFISNLLNAGDKRIGARNTTVVELSQTDFSKFMDDQHILGARSCSIRIGLLHDGEVVSAIGFNKIATNEKYSDDGYSLDRFANKNVNGAFAKILKYFTEKYYPLLIKSLADLEIVDQSHNVYVSNGFSVDEILSPDYSYLNPATKSREDKRKWRKPNLIAAGAVGDTEHEMALSIGLLRCYDSGKIRYIKRF